MERSYGVEYLSGVESNFGVAKILITLYSITPFHRIHGAIAKLNNKTSIGVELRSWSGYGGFFSPDWTNTGFSFILLTVNLSYRARIIPNT